MNIKKSIITAIKIFVWIIGFYLGLIFLVGVLGPILNAPVVDNKVELPWWSALLFILYLVLITIIIWFPKIFDYLMNKLDKVQKIDYKNRELNVSTIELNDTTEQFDDSQHQTKINPLHTELLPLTFTDKENYDDPLFKKSVIYSLNVDEISTSKLQVVFSIGYNRAARIIDGMEENKIISPFNGNSLRKVLINQDDFDRIDWSSRSAETNESRIPLSEKFDDNDLILISTDKNILNNDSNLHEVIEFVLSTDEFKIDEFQKHFDLNFSKTSLYLDTLKVLKLIDESYLKTNYFTSIDDVLNLIKKAISSNRNLLSELRMDSLEDGFAFENFIADLLIKNGYDEAVVTQGSNDFGVDVLAKKDNVIYAIQCKYYTSTVGNTAVQEIVSGKTHHNAHVGVVATSNYFTPQAIKLANSNNIILWDRDYILNLINKIQD